MADENDVRAAEDRLDDATDARDKAEEDLDRIRDEAAADRNKAEE